MGLPFALQLYSVRDHMQEDAIGTLKRVKEIGYDNVELAGTAGLTPAECKAALDEIGLTAVSAHFGFDEVTQNTQNAIDTCKTLSTKHAVMPHTSGESKAEWIEKAQALDAAGAKLREAGIKLSYHNHAHEFEKYDGEYAFDLLYANSKPENLCAQIDTFWVKYGKEDPVAMINKYAGRCPLLHIKDMAPEGSKPIFAPVGQGTMDWPPILAAGKAAGAEWYIVEQDDWATDSLEAARISAEFMAQQGGCCCCG